MLRWILFRFMSRILFCISMVFCRNRFHFDIEKMPLSKIPLLFYIIVTIKNGIPRGSGCLGNNIILSSTEVASVTFNCFLTLSSWFCNLQVIYGTCKWFLSLSNVYWHFHVAFELTSATFKKDFVTFNDFDTFNWVLLPLSDFWLIPGASAVF